MKQPFSRNRAQGKEGQWPLRVGKQVRWALWLHRITSRRKFWGCSTGKHPCHLSRLRRHRWEPGRSKQWHFAGLITREKTAAAQRNSQWSMEGLPGVFSGDLISTHGWGSYSRQMNNHLKGLEGVLLGAHVRSRTVLFPKTRVENLTIHRAGVDY